MALVQGPQHRHGAAAATHATDVGAGDPQLAGLADNGRPTATMLPAAASPLVGVVPVADCAAAADQRGEPRPLGAGCDIGAVEVAGLATAADDGSEGPGGGAGTDAIPVGDVREVGSLPETGATRVPGLALLALTLLAAGTALVRSSTSRPGAPPRRQNGG